MSIELSDINGKRVIVQHTNLKSGTQNILFSLHGIAKGVYLLLLKNVDGVIAIRAIVVQ